MEIKILDDFEGDDFNQVIDIYEKSFPAIEIRSVENTKKLLRSENYKLFVLKKEASVIGIAFVYVFENQQICLLDYMAISPEWQRQGLGTKIFQHVIGDIKNNHPEIKLMLLEIQREDVSDQNEIKIRQDRINFYKRLGVKPLLDKYILPPYTGNIPETTYLMAIALDNSVNITKEDIKSYVRSIYAKVYNYHSKDLLEKTLENSPDKFTIENGND